MLWTSLLYKSQHDNHKSGLLIFTKRLSQTWAQHSASQPGWSARIWHLQNRGLLTVPSSRLSNRRRTTCSHQSPLDNQLPSSSAGHRLHQWPMALAPTPPLVLSSPLPCEVYWGFLSQCSQAFELQLWLFPTEHSHVLCVITLLAGKAISWVTAISVGKLHAPATVTSPQGCAGCSTQSLGWRQRRTYSSFIRGYRLQWVTPSSRARPELRPAFDGPLGDRPVPVIEEGSCKDAKMNQNKEGLYSPANT